MPLSPSTEPQILTGFISKCENIALKVVPPDLGKWKKINYFADFKMGKFVF